MPHLGSQQITTALTNSVVGTPITGLTDKNRVSLVAQFTFGSGSTVTAKAYIQTSIDGGTTWYDIACFAFAEATAAKYLSVSTLTPVNADVTPTTGTLTDDTSVNGLLGDRIRMVVTSTGTYAGGTTLEVDYYATA
jgi:hypothetical protein